RFASVDRARSLLLRHLARRCVGLAEAVRKCALALLTNGIVTRPRNHPRQVRHKHGQGMGHAANVRSRARRRAARRHAPAASVCPPDPAFNLASDIDEPDIYKNEPLLETPDDPELEFATQAEGEFELQFEPQIEPQIEPGIAPEIAPEIELEFEPAIE